MKTRVRIPRLCWLLLCAGFLWPSLAAAQLTMAPDTLTQGAVGTNYSQGLLVTGGEAPYSFTVAAGALPPGLSLSGDGIISGVPTTVGTSSVTITASDSTAGTALTVSRDYLLQVVNPVPQVLSDSATVIVGQSVTIPVTANDPGTVPITGIAISTPPTQGTATVSGLDIIYTAPDTPSPAITFAYVAIGAGGSSNPATVTVRVIENQQPSAPFHFVISPAAVPVQVTLTSGATGGPFTSAAVVSVSPADAGSTAIGPSETGNGFMLTFVPQPAFSGTVRIRYTLSNLSATSVPGEVRIDVLERADPSLDPEVRGLVDAQNESARRFMTGQVDNFRQRLERLHDGGEGGFDNGLGFAIDRACIEPLVGSRPGACPAEGNGISGGSALANRADGDAGGAGGNRGAIGTWLGGVIRSGSHDGRNGGVDVDFESDGLSAGIDYRLSEALVLGAGIGYGKDENAIGSGGSRVDGEARTLALYASYHPGAWFVDMLLGYQALDYDLRRYVTQTGGQLDGQRGGSQLFASVAVGKDVVGNNALTLVTPYARLDLARARLDAYGETGDPLHALHFRAMHLDNATANLGVRMQSRHEQPWGRITPQFRLEYQYDVGGSSEAVIRYADIVDGPAYGLPSDGFGNSRVVVGLGTLLDFHSGWAWGLEYGARVGGGGETDSGLRVSLQKPF